MSGPFFVPVRQTLFVVAVFLVSLVVFGFAWYSVYSLFSVLEPIGLQLQKDLGTNSSTSGSVDTFMTNLVTFMAVLGLLATVLWGYQYSQRHGSEVYP